MFETDVTAILSYAQVMALLAEMHDVDDANLVAFRGRLQHFQRLGFPDGVNTGRGRAAQYGFGELIQLALAVELIQMGLPPERAIAVLRRNQFVVFQAVASTVEGETEWFRSEHDCWLGFAPAAMSSAFQKNVMARTEEEATFFFGGTRVIVELLHVMQGSGQRRLGLVHLSGVLRHIASNWIGFTGCTQEELIGGIAQWLQEQREQFAREPLIEADAIGVSVADARLGDHDASNPQA